MPWLLRDGEVLASLEVADSTRARMRGLLGRDELDGALLIERSFQVHTFGMRFPIDVAFLDGQRRVRTLVYDVRPWRLTLPRFGSRAVVEAQAGCFERWNLRVGDELEVR
jgi:uncharacterized membrane protein (UPF0127 family)